MQEMAVEFESKLASPTSLEQVGAVVIGRNEGERLIRCLDALLETGLRHIVYVDSGSTDASCQQARQRQLEVVELDLSLPFTAARARNAGFAHLLQQHPGLTYIQFIDGDCVLQPGWLGSAVNALDAAADVVAVCGWRQELYPEKSIYNQICDIEWRLGTIGEIACFGGDVLLRAQAFAEITGFNASVIAGEEPELSMRLRQAGWKILRLEQSMTLHDAQMQQFSQWWQRAKRAGHAYAQVSALHGKPPEYGYVKEIRRIWLWGAIIPFLSMCLAIPTKGLSLLVLGRYPVSALRAALSVQRQGWGWGPSLIWGISCAMAPFPQVLGAIRYLVSRWRHRELTIIEYKGLESKDAEEGAVPLGLWQQIHEDWVAHDKDWTRPGFRAVAVYRFGVWRMGIEPKLLRAPLSLLYRAMFRHVRNVYGIELPYSAKVGRRVIFEHQGGIVIHGNAELGDDCIIRQGVTLGNRYRDRPLESPKLGQRVNVGAGAKILGKVTLGDDANIGANAVVLEDVPAGQTAVGIPAKVLKPGF